MLALKLWNSDHMWDDMVQLTAEGRSVPLRGSASIRDMLTQQMRYDHWIEFRWQVGWWCFGMVYPCDRLIWWSMNMPRNRSSCAQTKPSTNAPNNHLKSNYTYNHNIYHWQPIRIEVQGNEWFINESSQHGKVNVDFDLSPGLLWLVYWLRTMASFALEQAEEIEVLSSIFPTEIEIRASNGANPLFALRLSATSDDEANNHGTSLLQSSKCSYSSSSCSLCFISRRVPSWLPWGSAHSSRRAGQRLGQISNRWTATTLWTVQRFSLAYS